MKIPDTFGGREEHVKRSETDEGKGRESEGKKLRRERKDLRDGGAQ